MKSEKSEAKAKKVLKMIKTRMIKCIADLLYLFLLTVKL